MIGEPVRVFLFVATLGYSRRGFTSALRHGPERMVCRHRGGLCAFRRAVRTLLIDNAKALVDTHDAQTRQVRLNSRFEAFCRHWDVPGRACAPFRARTKGKTENGWVTSRRTPSPVTPSRAGRRWRRTWRAGSARWPTAHSRHDRRCPAERFELERGHLRPIEGIVPFVQMRELVRRVNAEGCIELDTNAYSVPWRLIGETVTVVVSADTVAVEYAGEEVARHARLAGSRGGASSAATCWADSPPPGRAQAHAHRCAAASARRVRRLVGGGW